MCSFLFSKWRTITGLVDWWTVFFPYRCTPIQLVFKVPFLSQPANVTVERKALALAAHVMILHNTVEEKTQEVRRVRLYMIDCRWLVQAFRNRNRGSSGCRCGLQNAAATTLVSILQTKAPESMSIKAPAEDGSSNHSYTPVLLLALLGQ